MGAPVGDNNSTQKSNWNFHKITLQINKQNIESAPIMGIQDKAINRQTQQSISIIHATCLYGHGDTCLLHPSMWNFDGTTLEKNLLLEPRKPQKLQAIWPGWKNRVPTLVWFCSKYLNNIEKRTSKHRTNHHKSLMNHEESFYSVVPFSILKKKTKYSGDGKNYSEIW